VSWRNKKTGKVHAHGVMVGGPSNRTACRRVVLWERGGELRDDFESISDSTDADRCLPCVSELEYRIEWLNTWLGR
jgi:hypothetical protein